MNHEINQTDDRSTRVENKAEELKNNAAQSATQTKEVAKDKTHELVSEAKSALKGGAADAKSSVLRVADDRRMRAASRVNDYRRAATAAASKLKEDNDPLLGEQVEKFSTQLEKASDYLTNTDIQGLTRDVGGFTRKNPELVLGGALLLGFAMTRFLKASSQESSNPQSTRAVAPATASTAGYSAPSHNRQLQPL